MTRRVVEKLCTKKVCVDFWPLFFVCLSLSKDFRGSVGISPYFLRFFPLFYSQKQGDPGSVRFSCGGVPVFGSGGSSFKKGFSVFQYSLLL